MISKSLRISRGFTLIELLVTVAVLAVLMSLAAPALQQFIIRSEMQSLSNDFNNALQKAKLEAVSRNACVTVCAARQASGGNFTCRNSLIGDDWNQSGWLVYLNRACDTSITTADPASSNDIFLHRQPSSDRFSLMDTGSSSYSFSPRGVLTNAAAGSVNLSEVDNVNNPLNRTICIERTGRTRIIGFGGTC